jgi:RNA polymerase sigma-70 factor (ECF subfamily)
VAAPQKVHRGESADARRRAGDQDRLRSHRSLLGLGGRRTVASESRRSSLRTWVMGILSHKVIDHFRRRATQPLEGHDDAELVAAPSSEDVERVVAARERLSAVEKAIQSLPELERMALLLVDVEGLDRKDSCNALGVSATHLRVLLHRGRNRLRRMLEHD